MTCLFPIQCGTQVQIYFIFVRKELVWERLIQTCINLLVLETALLANCPFRDCRADVSAAAVLVNTDECYQTSSQDLEDCSKPSGLWTLATFRDVSIQYSAITELKMKNIFVLEYLTCSYNMKHVVWRTLSLVAITVAVFMLSTQIYYVVEGICMSTTKI